MHWSLPWSQKLTHPILFPSSLLLSVCDNCIADSWEHNAILTVEVVSELLQIATALKQDCKSDTPEKLGKLNLIFNVETRKEKFEQQESKKRWDWTWATIVSKGCVHGKRGKIPGGGAKTGQGTLRVASPQYSPQNAQFQTFSVKNGHQVPNLDCTGTSDLTRRKRCQARILSFRRISMKPCSVLHRETGVWFREGRW